MFVFNPTLRNLQVIVVPYRLSFSVEAEGATAVIDTVMDLVFLMDMILSVRACVYCIVRV
jgi:hypothetical protein